MTVRPGSEAQSFENREASNEAHHHWSEVELVVGRCVCSGIVLLRLHRLHVGGFPSPIEKFFPRLVKARGIVPAHGNRQMVHAFRITPEVDREGAIVVASSSQIVHTIGVLSIGFKEAILVVDPDRPESIGGDILDRDLVRTDRKVRFHVEVVGFLFRQAIPAPGCPQEVVGRIDILLLPSRRTSGHRSCTT